MNLLKSCNASVLAGKRGLSLWAYRCARSCQVNCILSSFFLLIPLRGFAIQNCETVKSLVFLSSKMCAAAFLKNLYMEEREASYSFFHVSENVQRLQCVCAAEETKRA